MIRSLESLMNSCSLKFDVDYHSVPPLRESDRVKNYTAYVTDGVLPHILFTEVPLGEALEVLLRSMNLTYSCDGNIIHVVSNGGVYPEVWWKAHTSDMPSPAGTPASSPQSGQYGAMSFTELKSLYTKQVAALSPEITKFREESPAFKAWQEAIEAIVPILVRGEKARLQLVQINAEGRWDSKSLGPGFRIDPRDGDIIGHPLIDQVVKTVFQKTMDEGAKVLVPGSEAALQLTRLMQRSKRRCRSMTQ